MFLVSDTRWCAARSVIHCVLQVLDVGTKITAQVQNLKDVSLFLAQPNVLEPHLALGLYVRAGSSDWLYRGFVHSGHPSEVMPLQVG